MGLALRDDGSGTPESVTEAEAAWWDAEAAGRGDVLRRALREVRANRPRQRHWSGLQRREIVETIRARLDGLEVVDKILDPLYGAMSMRTHPGLRTGQRSLELEDGRVAAFPVPSDRRTPLGIALIAAHMTRMALDLRHKLVDPDKAGRASDVRPDGTGA